MPLLLQSSTMPNDRPLRPCQQHLHTLPGEPGWRVHTVLMLLHTFPGGPDGACTRHTDGHVTDVFHPCTSVLRITYMYIGEATPTITVVEMALSLKKPESPMLDFCDCFSRPRAFLTCKHKSLQPRAATDRPRYNRSSPRSILMYRWTREMAPPLFGAPCTPACIQLVLLGPRIPRKLAISGRGTPITLAILGYAI